MGGFHRGGRRPSLAGHGAVRAAGPLAGPTASESLPTDDPKEIRSMNRTALLIVALALLVGCRDDPKDPNLLTASGHVEATDVRLSTKVGGRLLDFGLKEGDVVRPGQVIAHVDTTDVDLALGMARAEREQAVAELKLRLAGSRREDIA